MYLMDTLCINIWWIRHKIHVSYLNKYYKNRMIFFSKSQAMMNKWKRENSLPDSYEEEIFQQFFYLSSEILEKHFNLDISSLN